MKIIPNRLFLKHPCNGGGKRRLKMTLSPVEVREINMGDGLPQAHCEWPAEFWERVETANQSYLPCLMFEAVQSRSYIIQKNIGK